MSGNGNARGNLGIRANIDKAHEDLPDHVDLIVPMPSLNAAHKIRVDKDAKIITDEMLWGKSPGSGSP